MAFPQFNGSLFIALLFITSNAAYAAESLEFFRVAKDTVPYDQMSKYEVRQFPDRPGLDAYIERLPAFWIHAGDIREINIEAVKVYDPVTGGFQRKPERVSYQATFALAEKAIEGFRVFANQNVGETYELRLGKERLSLGEFIGQFTGKSLTIFFRQESADRINEILAPLKDKVKWIDSDSEPK